MTGLFRVSPVPYDPLNFSTFIQCFTVPGANSLEHCRCESDFERICCIGQGCYGIVYKVRDKVSNKIFALKELETSEEANPSDPTELMREHFHEISNMKLLKHINIVNLIEVAIDTTFQSTCLILEYCKYTLSSILDDDAHCLQHPQIKNIVHQLFLGLDFMHKQGVLHRDINPTNILFNESGILKISDFGSSRIVSEGELTPNVGTKWYRAPEILFGSQKYTSSVDIWSAGCIFGEMLLKKVLFFGETDFDIISAVMNLLGSPSEVYWPGLSNLPFLQFYDLPQNLPNRIETDFHTENPTTISLLYYLLTYDPLSRISADQCLNHQYFSEAPNACSSEDLRRTLESSNKI